MPVSRVILLILVSLSVGATAIAAEGPQSFNASDVAFYEKDVKPLLQKHCIKCHGPGEKIKGGLRLSTRADILTGGDTGPAVNFKEHEKSQLILAINNKRPEGDVMPPSGKLPDAEIAILTKWVKLNLPVTEADLGKTESAHSERGSIITDEAKKYWAFQPVKAPTVPNGVHPIDHLVNAKLAEKKLQPNGAAEKSALVRRLYYDLIGLPPTPEQVATFVNDPSPSAYEKLIDALLASPHYGEKWGRHWLDVVRYAETNGYERDGIKPNAWKYRDYVIRSFNADKPYDQFLKEQLAGDELPESRDAIIATGYYRLGIWDDEPADSLQALYDGYDDIVTVTSQGMLGLTMNCARCHDHKKDPILQSDYYRMVAFFRDIRPFSDTRGVSSSNNSTDITPPEQRKTYEAELKARQKKMDELKTEMEKVEDAAIKKMPAEDQRAAEGVDRPQVVAKVNGFFTDDQRKTYNRLKRERGELERKPLPNQEFALSVNNCIQSPPPVYVLARGNPHAPKEKELCEPGFPTVLGLAVPSIPKGGSRGNSSGRRSVLANWIASKDNPLTARVIVNRVWQHHFGRAIVPTPNDFGKLGELPTHPELLDWLADDFVKGGWTFKRLHKRILTSAAYQRSSKANNASHTIDPANQYLWRFNPRRLNAEEVRDSILSISGALKLDLFGPSVYPKIPQEVLAGQSVPGQGWLKTRGGGFDPAKPDEGNRRSVYVFVKRSLQVPILINHDQADTDSSCPVRYTTTVPTQALGMLNGEFTNEHATRLAKRLLATHAGDLAKQITLAIQLSTGRTATKAEIDSDVKFIEGLQQRFGLSAELALARYALVILNANEFVYLD